MPIPRAFAAAWQNQQGVVYRTVEAKVITNEEATVRSILDAMDWLVKSVTQRDIAVMFISAHGLRDVRQNYYLASAEIDPGSLRSTGVRFSEITEMLRDLPCKVLLFVDTYHSGGITGARPPAGTIRFTTSFPGIRRLSSRRRCPAR